MTNDLSRTIIDSKFYTYKEGERKILTCPACGGFKKFSLRKEDGSLLWNCFRASCNVKGISRGRLPIDKTKSKLNKESTTASVGKPLPEITTSVENHEAAMDYLRSVNSLEAYQNNLIDIKYSPSDERVVFYGTHGAVGRTLKPYGPKWVTYGDVSEGITVGIGDTAILVRILLLLVLLVGYLTWLEYPCAELP